MLVRDHIAIGRDDEPAAHDQAFLALAPAKDFLHGANVDKRRRDLIFRANDRPFTPNRETPRQKNSSTK